MDDNDAIGALVSDLHWQIDQMHPRQIKDNAGKPYTPAYYKRGLQAAMARGGLAVVEYVRSYLYRSPSDGYKKLADADSLDLACEALVADDTRPYAHLFTDEDRAAARKRLAPHAAAMEARKTGIRDRIGATRAALGSDLDGLREQAASPPGAEDAVRDQHGDPRARSGGRHRPEPPGPRPRGPRSPRGGPGGVPAGPRGRSRQLDRQGPPEATHPQLGPRAASAGRCRWRPGGGTPRRARRRRGCPGRRWSRLSSASSWERA